MLDANLDVQGTMLIDPAITLDVTLVESMPNPNITYLMETAHGRKRPQAHN